MLGFSGAESFPKARARSGETESNRLRRGPLTLVGRERVIDELAAAPVGQDERRLVGHLLRLLGSVLDLAIVFTVPYLILGLSTDSYKKLVFLYAAVASVLLIGTHRRLRLVPKPSEQVGSVTARIIGAAVLSSFLLSSLSGTKALSTGTRSLSAEQVLGELKFNDFALLVLVTVPVILLGRLLVFKLVHLARARGYDQEDTLIVGAGPVGVEVAAALVANPDFGLRPAGFVDRFDESLSLPIVGAPEDLSLILEETGVRDVVLAFGSAGEHEIVDYIRECAHLDVQFYAVPRFFELGAHANVGYEVDGFALAPMRRPGGNMWRVKRVFDIVVAVFLLLLTSPVFAICALAVKLSSPGPVFFRQIRIGIGGRPFEILKFRSMRVNDDSSTQWCVDHDDRVTSIGDLLRKSHLDELPQLLNVLRGDMAIVGPRPERPYFVEQFSSEIDSYGHRHRVPVGITGWAQVNGYWGDSSIEARVRLDNRYIENWSLWRDIVIGLRTIPTLLGKRR